MGRKRNILIYKDGDTEECVRGPSISIDTQRSQKIVKFTQKRDDILIPKKKSSYKPQIGKMQHFQPPQSSM